MIWNDALLFLHPQKTAGMAVTACLLATLRRPLFLSLPAGHAPADLPPWVTVVPGRRHEHLLQARALLAEHGRDLAGFRAILVPMRDPYDMEVSRYFHLRKPEALERGGERELALALPFAEFQRRSWFRLPDPIDGSLDDRHVIAHYYAIAGAMPANLRVLRFEALDAELAETLAPFGHRGIALPRRNVSRERQGRDYRDFVTEPAVEALIHRRYAWVFENGFYPRLAFSPSVGSAPT